MRDFPNESSFKSTNLGFLFFFFLNRERFILKVASVGLEADPSSQASSKVKQKRKIIPGIKPPETQGRAFASFSLIKGVDGQALRRCRACSGADVTVWNKIKRD